MSNENTAVKIEHVSKSFNLPIEATKSLRTSMVNRFKGIKGYKKQEVLKDISIEVEKGDFYGIVGRNGSGKSTLLKIISQIYVPDSGQVTVNGRLVSFIELGVGFNPELTGRENVYMNGAMLGFDRDEIAAMYDDIVEFAELEDFMNQKLKNYSSGMQVRLAFSVAIRSKSDILVLDEILAVGDEAFQKKSENYFFQAKREKKTIILVTHSMDAVRKYCNKAALIKDGEIDVIGNPDEVANAYSNIFINEEIEKVKEENKDKDLIQTDSIGLGEVRVYSDDEEVNYLSIKENFRLVVGFKSKEAYERLTIGLNLINQEGRVALATSTRLLDPKGIAVKKGGNEIEFDIQNVFPAGDYLVNLAIANEENNQLLLKQEDLYKIFIKDAKYHNHSLTHPDVEITLR